MSKGLYLEKLNWKKAEEVLFEDPVIVIPLGARLKEHGLHLPLNNDWIMAEYFAKRLLESCEVVMLPTLQHGFYPAFVEYPGSVNIAFETFKQMVADVCRSLIRHGGKRFYILNTGISTIAPLAELRDDLHEEFQTSGVTFCYSDFRRLAAEVEGGLQQQEAGTHADEIETSIMLYIAPEIVEMSQAQRDISGPDQGGRLSRDEAEPDTHYSPTGAWGDPTLATREKGQLIVEARVKGLHDEVQAMIANFRR